MSSTMPIGTRAKLSAMMFLQFMMLPVWFVPMLAYVTKLSPAGSPWPYRCGLIMAFGTFSFPFFGMFADRFMNGENVLAFCNFVSAALLACAYTVKDPAVLFVTLVLVMLFYMPTWSLTATIAMANSPAAAFPQIRLFGSLGWVASAVFSIVGTKWLGIENFDSTPCIFMAGAIAAMSGGILAFFLPPTLPKAKDRPMSLVDALGLRALVLFKRTDMAVFAILILLAMIPFQWYNVYCGQYLAEKGVNYLTVTMNLGQVFELIFMLTIPFILRKVGYKWAMVIGLGALAIRYGAFYWGASQNLVAGDFGGILVHGLIFGLLVVGSQMYVDAVAPAELRGQAQGLIGLILFGLGTLLSNFVFDLILGHNTVTDAATQAVRHHWGQPYLIAFVISVVLMVLMAVVFKPAVQMK
ncbi:MAG: MFS transporter [Lentisphaeria bacterium]